MATSVQPGLHQGGGYSVRISNDGSIQVKPGDSISKYSMAIHGDFNHFHEYGRRNAAGQIIPVDNVNLIHAGETLYFMPLVPDQPGGQPGGGNKPREIFYIGIDGTGPAGDAYDEAMKNSFVNVLNRNWIYSKVHNYFRGPTLLGKETYTIAQIAFTYLLSQLKANPGAAVCLAGHSRGGAAVIEVAYRLQRVNIAVDCMILFDAVDRSDTVDSYVIPKNVNVVHHALRNRLAMSRLSFGNCGRQLESRHTQYTEQHFWCTHTAVGGVPWTKRDNSSLPPLLPTDSPILRGIYIQEPGEPLTTRVTLDQDKAGAGMVWSWMFPRIVQTLTVLRHPQSASVPA